MSWLQVYPLIEAPRFQPLYIQKATLPDILDPVIEPHMGWLGHKDAAPVPAAGSGSGSGSSASDGPAAVAVSSKKSSRSGGDGGSEEDNDSDSDSSSSGLLQTLLQPVEIVEPTFRQLLVVYRKKPRPERWRGLWFRVTGQKLPPAGIRRSSIQMQVG